MKIYFDPGHGIPDNGAVGRNGTMERNVTLQVAKMACDIAQDRGHSARITRGGHVSLNGNKNIDLKLRYGLANEWKADVFVSIHCNAAANTAAHGFEIYSTPLRNNSDKLATCIFNRCKDLGLTMRSDNSDGDVDKEANFAVIKGTHCPSVLVELAFISNVAEEKLLKDPAFQKKAAGLIVDGIEDFKNGRG